MIYCALCLQTCRICCWNSCLEFKFNKQLHLQCPSWLLRVEGISFGGSFKLKQEQW